MTDVLRSDSQAGVLPTALEHIVPDVDDFFANHWGNQPTVFRAPGDLTQLIDEQEMWDEVECGLLVRPYFTAFNEGVRSALTEMTRSRDVVGHTVPGYVNEQQVREDFDAGGTFKFNQAEHWHPRIKALLDGLKSRFRGGLEAYVFLSPPGKTAIQAHMDGSHVLVLQVAGVKDWKVGLLDETSISDSDRYESEDIPVDKRIDVTLTPGDVLYMPHGAPHYATARVGNSIHLAITIEEPTAKDLSDVYLAQVLASPVYNELTVDHHRLSVTEKIAKLRATVGGHLDAADAAAVLEAAVRLKVEHLS
jgi:ribosomal protein L16 Arg81 hydroxylase